MEIISERSSSRAQPANGWLHDFFLFTPISFFAWCLAASYSMVEYACLSIVVTFYTKEDIKTQLAEAAILVCVQEGLASFVAIVLTRFTGERYGRRFYAIVFSTASYIGGIIILWSFDGLKPKPQHGTMPIFLVVSCLFAIGQGGADTVLKSFLEHNLLCAISAARRSLLINKRAEIYKNISVYSARIAGVILATFCFLGIKWPQVLQVLLIVMISSLLLFLIGTSLVLFLSGSSSTTEPMGGCYYFSLHTDNSATVSPKRSVRNMKWLLMFSCIAYSLVLATGNIFFQEQATKMKPLEIKKGKEVRFTFMIVIKSAVNEITMRTFGLCGANNKKQGTTLVRIGSGMVCAIICCVIAWQVEIGRKKVEDVKTDPNKTSVLWLCPHYVLLGLVKGLAQSGLEKLFGNDYENRTLLRNPGKLSKDMVSCVGMFLGIPCILIVRSWFKDFNKDKAHLDRYYVMLAMLSCAFFFIYVNVAFLYIKAVDDDDDVGSGNGDRVHVEST